MSKGERQKLIQSLVSQREIGTQRELVTALQAMGCQVTQATVSRDIRELDLQKVRTHLGRPRYVLSLREHPRNPEQAASHVLRDFCLLIVAAQNLVVVRCEIGTAQTVARAQPEPLGHPGHHRRRRHVPHHYAGPQDGHRDHGLPRRSAQRLSVASPRTRTQTRAFVPVPT